MTTNITREAVTDLVNRLRAPAYWYTQAYDAETGRIVSPPNPLRMGSWCSGSGAGHEGENDLPLTAADVIDKLRNALDEAERERDALRDWRFEVCERLGLCCACETTWTPDDVFRLVRTEEDKIIAERDAAIARAEAVTTALVELEGANEELCRLRTEQQYLVMIDGGQQDVLLRLDSARRAARSIIAKEGGDENR